MTKEEMFKEMEKMAPVLERNGVDIVLGKRIPGSFTIGYFFNEEAGLWEVYSCGERNDYFVRKADRLGAGGGGRVVPHGEV